MGVGVGVFFISNKLILWPLVACTLQDTLIQATFCVHCNGSLSRSGVRAKTEKGERQKPGETEDD